MTEPHRPDLFAYLDHRAYLRDWFMWKKTENPRFSHRLFARLAGHKSPSLLLLVSRGDRNLTDATLPGFIKALVLDPEEAEFFSLLVALDRASLDEERTDVFHRISASRRFRAARRIEGDSFRYLSHWYIPAVRELATCPGYRHDPAWIATALRPPITVEQAADALDTLEALGMVRVGGDGTVQVADATLATPREVVGLAVHNFHNAMLTRAHAAIPAFSPRERYLGAVTVAVPSARIADLKAVVAEFQERFLDLCDSMDGDADRVLQLNLQLFPMSAALTSECP
jgi:uncharacterized protein (TIGR02147 family)